MSDRLLTPAQVADILQMKERTLEVWRRRGQGPPWQKVGTRAVRYSEAKLRAWAGMAEEGS